MSAAPIALSSERLDPACGWRREALRPSHLRNSLFAEQYDWDTLFYDVYRAGAHVVLQGPPFLNLLAPLRATVPLSAAFGFPRFAARHVGEHKRGEIWWRSQASHVSLDGPLGRHEIPVQPDMAHLFAGRRVITTLSKDNALRWIADWVRFHARVHGADGVLVYDNGSTAYSLAELQATLEEAAQGAFPVLAVAWPFPYGPQGGAAGAVNGAEPDWDSDFCQTGSLQHARHRFLRHARAVLNVDIDELVLGTDGAAIFAATEGARSGFTKFPGRWIGTRAAPGVTPATCRHGDFVLRELPDAAVCPPKWCLVPGKVRSLAATWSVHNVFGLAANAHIDQRFAYRHMRAISNSWKEDRWADGAAAPAGPVDAALVAAFRHAGLDRPATAEGTVWEAARSVV